MISITCDKHRCEIQRKAEEAGLPPYISNETHGHLPEKELDELLVAYGNFIVTAEIDGWDECPDCTHWPTNLNTN